MQPGDLPPDSAQTSASANQDPPPRRRLNPINVVMMVGVGVVLVIFLCVAVLYGLQVAGLMDRW